LERNQKRTPANAALIEQAKRSTVPIYFFFQPSNRDELRYEGLVDVVDFEYIFDGERMVYRFAMERLEAEQASELRDAVRTVEQEPDDPSLTEDEEEFTEVQRRARSSVFTKRVKNIYDLTCAVCGTRRESPDGAPEVEAAHIHPRRDIGKDSIRNGIALCRFHHWAFDNGWIAVTDSYHVVVTDEPQIDGYEDVVHLQDQKLAYLPKNRGFRPLVFS
jgi:putative restriction endonuclease